MTGLPPGFKLKVGFTYRPKGVLTGQIHLMKPRKWWGYKKVATTITYEGSGDTDQTIIDRLMRDYSGESVWL